MAKIKQLDEVPYIDIGETRHFLSYPEEWLDGFGWAEEPVPFKATMRVSGSHRGRSAAQLVLEDLETKWTFPMFLNATMKMLEVCSMDQGKITGWWYFGKRGANYGIFYSTTEPQA